MVVNNIIDTSQLTIFTEKLMEAMIKGLFMFLIIIVLLIVVFFVIFSVLKSIMDKSRIIDNQNLINTDKDNFWYQFENQIKELEYQIKYIQNCHLRKKIKSIVDISLQIIHKAEQDKVIEKKIERYFTYYFPEIKKLIKNYNEIESVQDKSLDMKKSQEKIYETIDYAEKCIKKLFIESYDNVITEINVDTKVLNQMLKMTVMKF